LTKGYWNDPPIYNKKKYLKGKKKHYGDSNISPCKNIIIFKKSSKKKYIVLLKSSYNKNK
jgi:hypothetical protein